SSPQEQLDCVMRGLYLLRHAGEPIVVLLSNPDSRFEPPVLELLAGQRSVAQEAMKRLLEESSQDLVYKGRTIFLEEEERSGQVQVRFHHLPATPRQALVLPEAVLSVIERNVLGMFRH